MLYQIFNISAYDIKGKNNIKYILKLNLLTASDCFSGGFRNSLKYIIQKFSFSDEDSAARTPYSLMDALKEMRII